MAEGIEEGWLKKLLIKSQECERNEIYTDWDAMDGEWLKKATERLNSDSKDFN